MKIEYAEKVLQSECIVAPITYAKLVKVFGNNHKELHEVLNMFHEGKFVNYHMIPGNGSMSF